MKFQIRLLTEKVSDPPESCQERTVQFSIPTWQVSHEPHKDFFIFQIFFFLYNCHSLAGPQRSGETRLQGHLLRQSPHRLHQVWHQGRHLDPPQDEGGLGGRQLQMIKQINGIEVLNIFEDYSVVTTHIQCQYLEILRATIYQVEEFHIQRCDLFQKLFTIKCISIEKLYKT